MNSDLFTGDAADQDEPDLDSRSFSLPSLTCDFELNDRSLLLWEIEALPELHRTTAGGSPPPQVPHTAPKAIAEGSGNFANHASNLPALKKPAKRKPTSSKVTTQQLV